MRHPLFIALFTAAGLAVLLLRSRRTVEGAGNVPSPPAAVVTVTPELLAEEVQAVRGLRFRDPLKFLFVSAAALEDKVRADMQALVPPAEVALRVRAALALALIRPGLEFDAADCLAGSALEVPAAHYEAAAATMWVNDEFSPDSRPDLTARLVFHLARALVLQQHNFVPLPPPGNDDALLTAIAVLHADATITAQRHAQQHAGRAPSRVTIPESSTYHASPPFLRAVLAFPAGVASTFHAALRQQNPEAEANDFLNQILSRPPRTTAELLHPELRPVEPAAAPSLDREVLPDMTLLTGNSLGEFGARTLFKTQLTSAGAEPAAAGLLADRYWLFAGAGPGQDHLVWHTRWPTAEDAAAFLRALAATHLGNAGIPVSPSHFPAPDSFRATTPGLTLLASTGADHTVTFAASPDARIAGELLRCVTPPQSSR